MNKHDATIYLKGIKDFHGLDKDSEEAIDMAIEALSEERTGEWEDTIGGIYVCSNCKSSFTDIPKDGYWKPMWNYCPNCGAKMGGDTE